MCVCVYVRLFLVYSYQVSQEALHVLSDTVEHINTIFEEAEALDTAAYVEGCLACLTLCTYYIWPCTQTKYEKVGLHHNYILVLFQVLSFCMETSRLVCRYSRTRLGTRRTLLSQYVPTMYLEVHTTIYGVPDKGIADISGKICALFKILATRGSHKVSPCLPPVHVHGHSTCTGISPVRSTLNSGMHNGVL